MTPDQTAIHWSIQSWCSHDIDDKTLLFGLPCFAWTRIVKVVQLLSGLVIVKDIVGDKRLTEIADRFKSAAEARANSNTVINIVFFILGAIVEGWTAWRRYASEGRPNLFVVIPLLAVCSFIVIYPAVIGTDQPEYAIGYQFFLHLTTIIGGIGLYSVLLTLILVPLFAILSVLLMGMEYTVDKMIRFAIQHIRTHEVGNLWLRMAAFLLVASFIMDLATS